MKQADWQKNLISFATTIPGAILVFIIVFYLITFLVYVFYSPGPEERRQAEMLKTQSPPVVSAAQQVSNINITNNLLDKNPATHEVPISQQNTQPVSTQTWAQ